MAKRKKRSTKGRRKQPFKLKLPKETIYTLSSTGLIVFGAFIMVSLSRQSVFLVTIYNYFSSLFGWGILILPFLLISAGLMLTRLKWRITKPNVFVGSCLLLISSISLTKAGTVGQQIWLSLTSLIYTAGAILVLSAGIFVSFVVMFETSLEDILLFLQKFYQNFKRFIGSLRRQSSTPLLKQDKPQFIVKGLTDEQNSEAKTKTAPSQSSSKSAPSEKPEISPEIISNIPGAQQKMWHYPPLSILANSIGGKADRGNVKQNAAIIEQTLDSFGIKAKVVEVNNGPAVTQYAVEIAVGIKLSKVTSLQSDLALALAAPQGQIRIEAPIPGRSLVGLEIPNNSLEFVAMKKMMTSNEIKHEKSKLAVALGLDVSGKPVISDISKMPHVLIAGATGSGKSVCINSLYQPCFTAPVPRKLNLF